MADDPAPRQQIPQWVIAALLSLATSGGAFTASRLTAGDPVPRAEYDAFARATQQHITESAGGYDRIRALEIKQASSEAVVSQRLDSLAARVADMALDVKEIAKRMQVRR